VRLSCWIRCPPIPRSSTNSHLVTSGHDRGVGRGIRVDRRPTAGRHFPLSPKSCCMQLRYNIRVNSALVPNLLLLLKRRKSKLEVRFQISEIRS
jgi:hypothetical protein